MPAKQAWRVVWRQRRWLGGLLLLATGALWLSSVDRKFPERDFAAELKMLLLVTPFGLLWLVEHVRRRRPTALAKLTRAFGLLLVLKLVVFLLLMRASLVVWPTWQGHLGDDAYYTGFLMRSVLALVGRDDPTWRTEAKLGVGGWLSSYDLQWTDLGEVSFQGVFVSHVGVTAGLCWLTGFSNVAATTPYLLIAVCFTIQAYLFLYRFVRPIAATRSGLWLALGPDYLVMSCGIMKDFATAMAMLYLFEFYANGDAGRPSRRWFWLLPVTAFAYLSRPDSAIVVAAMAVYFALRARWQPRNWRIDVACILAAVVIGRVFSANMPRWSIFATYEQCLIGYVFFTPLFNLGVVAIDRNPSSHYIADIPLSLLWPLIISVITIGLTRYRTGAIRIAAPLLAWIMFWLVILTMSGFGLLHRYRIPVEVLIFGLASECFDALRATPVRQRRKLVAATGAIAAVLYAVSAVLLVATEFGR